jgi:hypothetical protein
VSNYEENIQNEEKVAELVGMLAENYNSMSASIKDLLARWIDKLASMFGLDPFDRNETYDMLNTIARKVAKGKVISEADVKTIPLSKEISNMNKRVQADFSDSVSKLTFVFDKNGGKFKKLEDDGYITKDKSLSDFNGKYVFLHQPDAAFSGMIYKDGEVLVEGKGGVFYPIKFHEDGYFWASTSTTAIKMADDLNKVMEQNGGTIYMALTSAPSNKLMSSTTMSNAVLDFFSSKALDKNFKINPAQLKSSLIKAANDVKFKKTLNKKTLLVTEKPFGLDLKLSSKLTIEEIQSAIKTKLASDKSSFEDRKNFALELTKLMATEINKNDVAINQFGKLFSEGIQNKYFKGITKTGKLKISATNMTQALSEMFTEPMLKEGIDRDKGGQVYAILELNGAVKPFKTDQHESYPMAIKSDSNSKVKLHILKDRQNWYDVFEDFETNEIVASKERQAKIYPTTGVSVRGLRVNTSKIKDQVTPRKQIKEEVAAIEDLISPRKQLTAPNGKPSNLNEKQWNQVRTPEFKKWFGDWENDPKNASKVVDENGEPLVVYHGTDATFDAFIPGWAQGWGKGIYFTDNKEQTKEFGENTIEAFINIKNPVTEENYSKMDLIQNTDAWKDKTKKLQEKYGEEQELDFENEFYENIDFLANIWRELGHDGIIFEGSNSIEGQEIVSFNSNQIKSATENEGTFSAEEKSIRKQKPKSINDIVKITKDQGFSDAAIREYLKQQGFSDKQATAAINEYNVKKEGIFVRKDGGIPTKIVDSIRSFRRRMFSARSFLPKSVFASRENKDASVATHLNIVDQNVKDFNRLYARYKGTKAEKDKLVENFDAYIRGDKSVKLPEEFMAVANSMRNQIDGLSMQLISSGLVDVEMAQTIKDNLGQYLTRSYKIYDRANWKKEVENEVKQKAINLLKSQYKEMAQELANKEGITLDEALDNLVTNRLDEMLTTDGANNFITGSKLGSKDLSVLKERQDIPIEIRMLLGEYSDPALNYAKTVLKLSSLAANHKFLTEIKKTGMGVYFFEKNDPRRPADFNTMVATEGSESMNPLNGLYTTKEIADAFMSQPSELSGFWKTFMKFQSSIRWLKTIGSIATHIKNVFGNIGFVLINAHVDPKEVGRAFMTVKNDFSKGTNQQRRDKMNNYISLGIVKQSAGLGEIMDMFKDANWDTAMASRLSNQKLGLIGKAKRIFLQGKKKMEDAYQAEDDFFKIVAYENELSRYSKAMFKKDKSDLTQDELAEVNKVVAEIVKNTYPTYDRIPEAIKMVRRAPFIGNFVSFQAESYRTAFNTIALAKNELTSDNNKVKAIGAQRLAGATTYLSAKSAILSYFSMAAGTGLTGLAGYLFDDEDEDQRDKDIRKFVAPWSKKSDLLMISVGDGKMKYIDFSSSDPHGGMKKVMNAFFLGETTIDGFSAGIAETFAPFIGEDMTVEALLALKNNKDKYGNPIYNSEESLQDQSQKVLSYMYKLVEPGTFSSIRRGWAAEDKTNELVANLTGFRTYDVPIVQQFGYMIKDYSARIKNAKSIYNSAAYNEKATEADKEKAYKKAQESLNGIYSEITDLYNSAERLGCDPKDLGTVMSDFGNMSKRTVRDIKSGELPELKKK